MRISDWSSDVCSSDLKNYHRVDATHSLGLGTDDKGAVSTVIWNSPAFKAGLDVGDAITAINGAAFSADRLNNAIRDAKTGQEIGRASCRERVCQYVEISVVDGSLKKKNT